MSNFGISRKLQTRSIVFTAFSFRSSSSKISTLFCGKTGTKHGRNYAKQRARLVYARTTHRIQELEKAHELGIVHAPNDKVFRNERIASSWPARGGAPIHQGPFNHTPIIQRDITALMRCHAAANLIHLAVYNVFQPVQSLLPARSISEIVTHPAHCVNHARLTGCLGLRSSPRTPHT